MRESAQEVCGTFPIGRLAAALTGAALLLTSGAVWAHDDGHEGPPWAHGQHGHWVPPGHTYYYAPPPVFYRPAPVVVYQPPPVVYEPVYPAYGPPPGLNLNFNFPLQ